MVEVEFTPNISCERRRVCLYNKSAAAHPKPCLRAVRRPSDLMGCSAREVFGLLHALSSAFSVRWNPSTRSLAAGWYTVVRILEPQEIPES